MPVNFFDSVREVKNLLQQKDPVIFLDYDGTLTPIVETPDLAILSERMRAVLKQLIALYKVSIVSGRATDDVRRKVNIEGIFYAGSHGFEIVDPQGDVEINEEAQNILQTMTEVQQRLSSDVKDIPGALIENVKYTVSAHYRRVSDADYPQFIQAVEKLIKEYPSLRITRGKKVCEIRPDIDWDKGRAVEWILQRLNFNAQNNFALYIGDDTTDEDAFRVVETCGFGILVADPTHSSKARYVIKDTGDVLKVLQWFINFKVDGQK